MKMKCVLNEFMYTFKDKTILMLCITAINIYKGWTNIPVVGILSHVNYVNCVFISTRTMHTNTFISEMRRDELCQIIANNSFPSAVHLRLNAF